MERAGVGRVIVESVAFLFNSIIPPAYLLGRLLFPPRRFGRDPGEESIITFLRESGRLRPGLSHQRARDIFWMLTGGDVYRMLVRERGWSSQEYQEWLADTLVDQLLASDVGNPTSRCKEPGN
jgi:hypothetical protein